MNNKKIARKQVSQKVISLIILSGIVVVITMKMYQSFKVDLLFQDIRQLDQVKKSLVNENRQLQADVDRLSNIDRITDIARKEYGMIINTDQPEVIIIENVDRFESIKKRFAKRNGKDETVNMAGVH